MASQDPDKLFDLRTVKRNIRAGLLSSAGYAEFLGGLPDMVDNVKAPEENSEEDAFESMGSSQPGEDEDENAAAPADSAALATPHVPTTVSATPVAPAPAPPPPRPTVQTAVDPVRSSPAIEQDSATNDDPFADAPLPGQMHVPPVTPAPAQPASSDDSEPDGD